ncbi:MAG: hypothetical protein O2812_00905 [Chloroflexi bacterium]|nr:hypothetical protein [Chloroflexota bacterium]
MLPGESGLRFAPRPKPKKKQQNFPLFVGERGPILTPAPVIKPKEKRSFWGRITNKASDFRDDVVDFATDVKEFPSNVKGAVEDKIDQQQEKLKQKAFDALGIVDSTIERPWQLGGRRIRLTTIGEGPIKKILDFQGAVGLALGGPLGVFVALETDDEGNVVDTKPDPIDVWHEFAHAQRMFEQGGALPWHAAYQARLGIDTIKYGGRSAALKVHPEEAYAYDAAGQDWFAKEAKPSPLMERGKRKFGAFLDSVYELENAILNIPWTASQEATEDTVRQIVEGPSAEKRPSDSMNFFTSLLDEGEE